MRIGLVASLLLHTAVITAAWWLLRRSDNKTLPAPALHFRETNLEAPEFFDPPVLPSPQLSLPDEPIDAVQTDVLGEVEFDERTTVEAAPEWVMIRHPALTRPIRLRPRSKPVPRSATPTAPKLTAPKRAVPVVLISAKPIRHHTPAARYPSRAKRLGLTGTVQLRARVGTDGLVVRVEILRTSGSKLLDQAAIDALKLWRFTPAHRAGKPAAQWVRVPFRFQLRNES